MPTWNDYKESRQELLRKTELAFLEERLIYFRGNICAMARALRINRPNLYRLLRRHKISVESFR